MLSFVSCYCSHTSAKTMSNSARNFLLGVGGMAKPLKSAAPVVELASSGSRACGVYSCQRAKSLSHRLPPFRRPPGKYLIFRSFFVFFFDVVFGPLLNAYFSLLEPQNLPKWSPNPPKIDAKRLPKSILSCARRKVISSKHSHTFAHFCISRGLQNRPEIAPKYGLIFQCL